MGSPPFSGTVPEVWCVKCGKRELGYVVDVHIIRNVPGVTEPTFAVYQEKMCEAAKAIQGENYIGDAYYMQMGTWEEHWLDGTTPEEAVRGDMECWEP
jgi:hypothetical protein